jgi:hypothetical protein
MLTGFALSRGEALGGAEKLRFNDPATNLQREPYTLLSTAVKHERVRLR